jgi:hypothetical protein
MRLKVGDKVQDADGDIGTVKECYDPHNVFVEYPTGHGLYCVKRGCDMYESLKLVTKIKKKKDKHATKRPAAK